VDVAAAFIPLGRHWHGGWVFPELTYPEFLAKLARLLKRHAELGTFERLLFSPWLNPPGEMEQPASGVPATVERKSQGAAGAARAA
jgi:hypothetical protein